jgi:hypothetical protein
VDELKSWLTYWLLYGSLQGEKQERGSWMDVKNRAVGISMVVSWLDGIIQSGTRMTPPYMSDGMTDQT